MQTEMPFFESPEDALKACIQALGGAKKVGAALFPDKTIDNARDYLQACVNPDRAEKLSLSQLQFVFRESKRIGFHAGVSAFMAECEYEVRAITLEEETDRLTAVIEQAAKALALATGSLERIQNGQRLKVV